MTNVLKKLFSLIDRYGVEKDDVFRGINDTTNSALSTGLKIAGGRCPNVKGTTCYMHTQELVTTHALGLKTRKRNGEVVDSFPDGKNLRDDVKLLLSKIMDKKAKGRFREYDKMCRDLLKVKARKLELPNDTRISGVYRMYVSALRSKRIIWLFLASSEVHGPPLQQFKLSERDWQFVAETESLLRTMDVLAMSSQKESVSSNVFSYYLTAQARYYLNNITALDVVNLGESWGPDKTLKELPKIKIRKENLMEETKELLIRFDKEFLHYFAQPDSDQILMMGLHPLMFWNGFR
jgi:hypothetical protein